MAPASSSFLIRSTVQSCCRSLPRRPSHIKNALPQSTQSSSSDARKFFSRAIASMESLLPMHNVRAEALLVSKLSAGTLHSSFLLQGAKANTVSPNETELRQRTEEWQQLRQERLTSSAFPSVLGIWGNFKRVEVWAEKLSLKKPFIGNSATEWGVQREPDAIEKYQEITGYSVRYLAFKIYEEGNKEKEWLGASPDGLVDEEDGNEGGGGGVLEVKCPHNKGSPGSCIPWTKVPYYYMPQLQGLMEILNRDWLDLFVWTLNGSAIFRVERDREYWDVMFGVLKDFWWGSVIPGRKSLSLSEGSIDVNIYKPIIQHRLTPLIIKESKRLSKNSFMINKTIA